MPLQVIVIGGGIAGLTAAASLRNAGHSIKILERSAFAGEVGAAINLAPNGTQTLLQLGFDPVRARTVPVQNWDNVDGTNLERTACADLSQAKERFGAPYLSVHRVDLHNELQRLADEGGDDVSLSLSSPVVEVNPDEGWVKLGDGSVEHADLIVAADGLHSVARDAVTNASKHHESKLSAFRFLLDREVVEAHPSGKELLAWKTPGALLLADPNSVELDDERHLMWYSCRDGNVENFVGVHPTSQNAGSHKDQLIEQFGHFDSKIVDVLKLAEDVKCWPLVQADPLPTWTLGNVVLIGDAAHPMLPFGGQGSNQAIEDGAALGWLFDKVDDKAEVPNRLKLFEEVRRRRATRVQILSTVRANREELVKDRVEQYSEEGVTIPTSIATRVAHDAGYNTCERCKEALDRYSSLSQVTGSTEE